MIQSISNLINSHPFVTVVCGACVVSGVTFVLLDRTYIPYKLNKEHSNVQKLQSKIDKLEKDTIKLKRKNEEIKTNISHHENEKRYFSKVKK
ncbi:hypothetical protein JYU12_00720 [bacterium AH-315-K03]|nr:hypothetical protein [bacterium AH-315-K03]